MKVKKLIEILKTLDKDLPILIAGDSEGNYFNMFNGIDSYSVYREAYGGGYDVIDPTDAEENEDCDEMSEYKKCVVIWP